MEYKIERIHHCDKTYNGYIDCPYWQITIGNLMFGLKDNGKVWRMDKGILPSEKAYIKTIIEDCKLNITLI